LLEGRVKAVVIQVKMKESQPSRKKTSKGFYKRRKESFMSFSEVARPRMRGL